MMKRSHFTVVVGFLVVGSVVLMGCSEGHDHTSHDHGKVESEAEPAKEAAVDPNAKPYPLDICVVSNEELGPKDKVKTLVHEGQTVKFCCADCIGEFKKDPAKYLKLMAEAKTKK